MNYIDYILKNIVNIEGVRIGGSYILYKYGVIPIEMVDDIDVYVNNSFGYKERINKFNSTLDKIGFKRCMDTKVHRTNGKYMCIPNDSLMKVLNIHEVYDSRFKNAADIESIYLGKVWRIETNFYSQAELDENKKERDIKHVELIKEYVSKNNEFILDKDLASDRMKGMLFGAIIGDILGVPYEFSTLENMKESPFTREYVIGGYHDQPKYSWSDDTSMSLALISCGNTNCLFYNHRIVVDKYIDWYEKGKYTSNGVVFDYGTGTRNGLLRYKSEDKDQIEILDQMLSESKGNGVLMRIHPLIGFHIDNPYKIISENVRVTHDNDFSVAAALIYFHILLGLRAGEDIKTSYEKAVSRFDLLGEEVLPKNIEDLRFIEANGYAYNTIINTVLCIYKTTNFLDAVSMAINLGLDTDTNASIVGAMAGLIYGYKGIDEFLLEPFKTLDSHKEVADSIEMFVNGASSFDYRKGDKYEK